MCYLESEHDIENIRKATMRMVFAVSDDGCAHGPNVRAAAPKTEADDCETAWPWV